VARGAGRYLALMSPSSVSWPTVAVAALVSAGVSGLVTLAADYFARPGLEARKERLLERYRAKRDFGTLLMRVQIAAAVMLGEVPADFSAEQRAAYDDEMQRQRDAVQEATRLMEEQLPLFAVQLPRKVQEPVTRYAGWARGIAISDKSRQDAAVELGTITAPLNDFFNSRGRGRMLRPAYLRQARRTLGV